MPKIINENYIHDCGETKVDLKIYNKSIIDMGYRDKEILDIMDFYLLNAPIKHNNNDNNIVIKSLSDYGWKGNPDMTKLEGMLLKSSRITTFCILKSDSISQTLKSMDLDEKICCIHPRAVIKQNCDITIEEDGTAKIMVKETRMECLFRHIRNSIAHNCTYLFKSGNILLEDKDDKKNITCRILIPKEALVEWIYIVKNKNKHKK